MNRVLLFTRDGRLSSVSAATAAPATAAAASFARLRFVGGIGRSHLRLVRFDYRSFRIFGKHIRLVDLEGFEHGADALAPTSSAATTSSRFAIALLRLLGGRRFVRFVIAVPDEEMRTARPGHLRLFRVGFEPRYGGQLCLRL